MWQTDKDDKIIPKYDHYYSDEMMSVVYGMTNFSPRKQETEVYTTGNFARHGLRGRISVMNSNDIMDQNNERAEAIRQHIAYCLEHGWSYSYTDKAFSI
jgi:hypothetical protein